MIPVNVDRTYLEEIYDFKVEQGKTLRTVDEKPQWIVVLTFTASCLGKPLKATQEILADKATPLLVKERTDKFIDTLKMTILRIEERETNG